MLGVLGALGAPRAVPQRPRGAAPGCLSAGPHCGHERDTRGRSTTRDRPAGPSGASGDAQAEGRARSPMT
eukprot:15448937-Alexandrium_andersonii.AAC.1